jgi:hypothetical protein
MTPPTQPLPASTILQTLLSNHNRLKSVYAAEHRIRTGYAGIDEYVLQGGVERGVVLGVSADVVREECGRMVSWIRFYLLFL